MVEWHTAKRIKHIHSFLGMAGFYTNLSDILVKTSGIWQAWASIKHDRNRNQHKRRCLVSWNKFGGSLASVHARFWDILCSDRVVVRPILEQDFTQGLQTEIFHSVEADLNRNEVFHPSTRAFSDIVVNWKMATLILRSASHCTNRLFIPQVFAPPDQLQEAHLEMVEYAAALRC